jgi:general secretion pathway protein D
MRNRRIALNAKASVALWMIGIALGWALYGAPAQAAAPHTGVGLTALALAGQASAPRSSEELLREARAAIKRSDFAKAETLITDAEKLGVKYNALTARMYDTPDKLRRLLAEERSKANAASKSAFRLPSLFGGAKQEPAAVPADPTMGAKPANPQAVNNAVQQITDDGKSRAMMHLKDARAALARGDKMVALAAWQKAAAIKTTFGPTEDSPQRVADELVRAGIDPNNLKPAAGVLPASPYALRPPDNNPMTDRLPQLGGTPGAIPAAAAPSGYSPYNLPAENNPLVQSAPPGSGGAFQPATLPAAPSGPIGELQRLPVGDANAKAEAAKLMSQARLALDKGDLKMAEQLAVQAESLNVPDTAFGPGETRPWQMTLDVNRAVVRREGVVQASGNTAVEAEPRYPVAQGLYDPQNDGSKLVPATSQGSVLSRAPPGPNVGGGGPGDQLYQEGMQALQGQDREGAVRKFAEAWKYQDQLDPETRQQLKDKLTFLRSNSSPQPLPSGAQASPLEEVNSQQDLLRQKLYREILNEEKAAETLAKNDPRGALANLQKLRDRVAAAEVAPAAKKQLLVIVDGKVKELTTFIDQNKATIESTERNEAIKSGVVRDQEVNLQTQNKLAEMVEQFNKLMDERRFSEAEVIARQARDIAPEETVVVNMFEKARLAHAIAEDMSNKERKEDGFLKALQSVDQSSEPFDDRNPIVFGKVKDWLDLTKSRSRLLQQQNRLSPAEQEIQRSLSKLVEVKFQNRPLAEVMDTLGRMSGVNVYLDPQGLNAEGVTSDTPVSLNLTQPISLKSALNLVLSPLGLSYVIQNEVLRITSEQTRDSNTHVRVYYVADLVMPIPNFVPSYNLGLPGAIRESINAMGYGVTPRSGSGPLTLAKDEGEPKAMPSSTAVLAQANQFGPGNAMQSLGTRAPTMAGGPGGLGGGSGADFDSLIELIEQTIAPQSWDTVGGVGSVSGFETNLSLVVSQTQEVHEQIADLLDQLRRLQDLQVTIECRFITLADNFFERIGVDFDLSIDDNSNVNDPSMNFNFNQNLLPSGSVGAAPSAPSRFYDDANKSISVGWTGTGVTPDLDIKFSNNSLGNTTPPFGGFAASDVATFGFAILSDLEVFFLLEAAQGDNRTNILQAPKVTLFNGQTAFVSDTTQRPFVTTVIPVVGDFAAAQQPVIVVLNEGTSMNVQAVVSNDRRFVRLTLVPFFSQVGDVDEFTFEGSVTTDSGTTVQDPSNPDQNVTNGQTRTVQGTTVQLPTFAFTTVTTTVSVPDGGTVLLGGIKRLREGRTERGVPILSKVPWVSRLFKNVGIGRDANSLMMMVTPRIIIQEEEEAKLGIEIPEGP